MSMTRPSKCQLISFFRSVFSAFISSVNSLAVTTDRFKSLIVLSIMSSLSNLLKTVASTDFIAPIASTMFSGAEVIGDGNPGMLV